MNILIRAEGVIGELSGNWYKVPTKDGSWVRELLSCNVDDLCNEIIQIESDLEEVIGRSSNLVLHFGKYDDLERLCIHSEALVLFNCYKLELEIY